MKLLRASFVAVLAAVVANAATPAAVRGATLPPLQAAGFRTVDGPKGGRMVFAREPSVADPIAALREAGRTYLPYLQSPLNVRSVVESADRRSALATFTAQQRGVEIAGVLIVARSGGGAQLVALIDRADRLKNSVGAMISALNGGSPSPADAGTVHTFVFPDNTGSVAVPAGWHVTNAGEGHVIVIGPHSETAIVNLILNLVDPAHAVSGTPFIVAPYEADPAAAFVVVTKLLARSGSSVSDVTITKRHPLPSAPAAPGDPSFNRMYIEGSDLNQDHQREGFVAILSLSSLSRSGTYSIRIEDFASTTVARQNASAPILLGILHSYKVHDRVLIAQVQQRGRALAQLSNAMVGSAIASSQAESQAAHESQEAMDRSTSGVVHYLNNTNVVEHIGSGGRGAVDSSFAQAMVQADPQSFRIVPVSQYRSGD